MRGAFKGFPTSFYACDKPLIEWVKTGCQDERKTRESVTDLPFRYLKTNLVAMRNFLSF
jgi:hypothetical protein